MYEAVVTRVETIGEIEHNHSLSDSLYEGLALNPCFSLY